MRVVSVVLLVLPGAVAVGCTGESEAELISPLAAMLLEDEAVEAIFPGLSAREEQAVT